MRRFVGAVLLAAAGASAGCGSGNSTAPSSTPSTPLMAGFNPGPAPDPSKGFQIISPIVHDIEPGASVEYCTYTNITTTQDIAIKSTESVESLTGHHVVIFYTKNPQPPDTHICSGNDMAEFNMGVAASAGEGTHTMTLPGDLVVQIPAGSQIIMNHHYLNAGSTAVADAQAAINVFYADPGSTNVNSASVVVTDTSMSLPVGNSTYSVDCTVDRPYTIWQMAPHMHAWGTHITIDHTSGTATDRLFDLDWSADFAYDTSLVMKVETLSQPYMLNQGDKIHIQCDYANGTNAPLAFGQEMCLFFGFTVDATNVGNVMCDLGHWGSY